ncbi:hypothetical protein K7G98_42025, partial [Saccharothrix sp. MB29]|nr:hypothetical protein [Saccharothrix sp. MB29]
MSVKAPELFGLTPEADGAFYGTNAALFALPWLAAFLAWRADRRRPARRRTRPGGDPAPRPPAAAAPCGAPRTCATGRTG